MDLALDLWIWTWICGFTVGFVDLLLDLWIYCGFVDLSLYFLWIWISDLDLQQRCTRFGGVSDPSLQPAVAPQHVSIGGVV